MPSKVAMINKKFGRLTVIKESTYRNRSGSVSYVCECQCGNQKIISGIALRKQLTKSCGCWAKEVRSNVGKILGKLPRKIKPGRGTQSHQAWFNMKARCRRSKGYFDRGIGYDPKWDNFDNFYIDMGNPPSEKHSLGRIDNNAGYCKSNCRWETVKQQSLNTRQNHWIVHNGVRKTVSEWSHDLGGRKNLVSSRLKLGWSESEAVSIPRNPRNKT